MFLFLIISLLGILTPVSCQNANSLAAFQSAVSSYLLSLEQDPVFEEEIAQITNVELLATLEAIQTITIQPQYFTGYPAFFTLLPPALTPVFESIYTYEYELGVQYGVLGSGAATTASGTGPSFTTPAVTSATTTPDSFGNSNSGSTSSGNSSSSSSSSSLSTGAIVGIAVGGAAGLALIGVAVFLIMRRRKKQKENASPRKVHKFGDQEMEIYQIEPTTA